MDQQIHLRGVSVDVHWTLVQCEPETLAVWEGRGPARSRACTEYKLQPLPGGCTRFDYRNEFRPPLGPFGALASRALVGGMPEREGTRTVEPLRALLERSHYLNRQRAMVIRLHALTHSLTWTSRPT